MKNPEIGATNMRFGLIALICAFGIGYGAFEYLYEGKQTNVNIGITVVSAVVFIISLLSIFFFRSSQLAAAAKNIQGMISDLSLSQQDTVAVNNSPDDVKPENLLKFYLDLSQAETSQALKYLDAVDKQNLFKNKEKLEPEKLNLINRAWTFRQDLLTLWQKAGIEFHGFLETQKECFESLRSTNTTHTHDLLRTIALRQKPAFTEFSEALKHFNHFVENNILKQNTGIKGATEKSNAEKKA